jgi:hypothetical protein
MRKLLLGFPGTFLVVAFLLLGSGLIIAGAVNDGLILCAQPGILFLALAALVLLGKDFARRH